MLNADWGDDVRVLARALDQAGDVLDQVHRDLLLALHTWDLATAIGYPVGRLDAEVASRALEFLRSGLTPENRGGAFGPERPAAEDAGPYARLAAFAGRSAG